MPSEQLKNLVLEPELLDEMATFLADQIETTDKGRKDLEELWVEIEELYELTILEEKENFPFEGAAHLMVQLIPLFCEAMKAKLFNTIFAPEHPFTPVLHRGDFSPFIKPLMRFLTWATENELHLRKRLDPIILELYKLGTTIAKVVYTRKVETLMKWDETLEEYQEEVIVTKDSPEIVHPQLPDVYFPLQLHDLDEAEWIAERFRMSRNDLVRGMNSEKYMNMDQLEKMPVETQQTEFEEKLADIPPEVRPQLLEEYEFHECWFEYAIREGKDPVKLFGILHLPTRTFIRLVYWWFPYGLHPYELCVHEGRTHRVYGNGVGSVGAPYQREVSTMHNQRLDAMTIANANVFKRKADSLIPEDLVWRAGGTIPVDDMDDLAPLFSGQKFDSTLQEEQHTIQLLKERVGIQEFTPEMVSGAQSTTALALLGESTRRFDQNVETVRIFLGRLMTKAMLLYQKYYPEGKPIMVQGEEGRLTEQIIKFPEEWIVEGMGIEVTATTSATSAEMDRQSKLSLFGLQSQVYGQVAQYLIQAANPQFPLPVRVVMLQTVDGILTYYLDILGDFNLNSAREISAGIEGIKKVVRELGPQLLTPGPQEQPGMGGPQGAPGGAPAGAGGQAPQG